MVPIFEVFIFNMDYKITFFVIFLMRERATRTKNTPKQRTEIIKLIEQESKR